MLKIRVISISLLFLLTLSTVAFAQQSGDLSTIVVDATTEGSLVRNYAPGGLLGDNSPLDLPFVSSSISEYAIQNFAVPGGDASEFATILSLNPSIRDSVSMFTETYFRGFRFRGYDVGINGLGGMFGTVYVPSFAFEGVDIISGPSLGYAGTTSSYHSSGGTANYKTKVARVEPQIDASIIFSGKSSFTERLDVGRRFGNNKEWGIRGTFEHTDGETIIDGAKDYRLNFMINADRQTPEMKSNLAVGHFQYDSVGNNGGRNMFIGAGVTEIPKAFDTTVSFGPDWNKNEIGLTIVTFNHEQKIREWFKPFIDFGYTHEKTDPYIATVRLTMSNNDGDYTGRVTREFLEQRVITVQGGVKGTIDFEVAKNSYLLAFGYTFYDRNDNYIHTNYAATGNIYDNPKLDWENPLLPVPDPYVSSETRSFGVTFMDTLSFYNDKIRLYAGVHWHNHDAKSLNASGETTQQVKSSNASPTFGVVVTPIENLSLFANHTESFASGTRVGASYLNAREILDPLKTKQDEFGFKYQFQSLVTTLSFFQITQGATRAVPGDGGNYLVTDGENRNRGAELSFSGTLFDKLNLLGGVSYIDATQRKTQGGANDGVRSNAIAKWSATIAGTYRFNDNFTAIGRLYYLGKAPLRNETLETPAYSVLDLGLSYTQKIKEIPFNLTVKCNNVFNEAYWKPYNNGGTNGIILGTPRSFQVSLGATF
jgi:iron complex outermembrane receptor protein